MAAPVFHSEGPSPLAGIRFGRWYPDRGADLEVVAARVRPLRLQVLGRLTSANYHARPAAEWGAEYTRLVRRAGLGHVSAIVLLPRSEVIVRQVTLPGVAVSDKEGAIRFQLDTLHPHGDAEVCWGWSALADAAVATSLLEDPSGERQTKPPRRKECSCEGLLSGLRTAP